jgi:hypothetical protein
MITGAKGYVEEVGGWRLVFGVMSPMMVGRKPVRNASRSPAHIVTRSVSGGDAGGPRRGRDVAMSIPVTRAGLEPFAVQTPNAITQPVPGLPPSILANSRPAAPEEQSHCC